jgi:predicted phosphodiesterase
MPRSISGEKVYEYAKKYPNTSNRALGALLFRDYPMLFTSAESARKRVCDYRGGLKRKGDSNRNAYIKEEYMLPKSIFTKNNPYGLPESYSEKRKPFLLPKVCDNILILSDLHIPYQENAAIQAALDYGKKNRINTIFINGDLFDFHAISKYDKDPRKRSFVQEIETGLIFLTNLRKSFSKASIYVHWGNHDIRYESFLKIKCPELFGDEYYELSNRLGFARLRITEIGDKQITKAGKLNIFHGHTIFRGSYSPESPSRKIYMKTKMSSVCGHTHKISETTETNLDGSIVTCWSTGCLCELSPDYFPHCNNYGHGFAHAIIDNSGNFSLKNYRIYNGKIL